MELLFDTETIAARVKALGEEISGYYRGKELTVLVLANGGCFFGCDLVRNISEDCWFDVAALSSYVDDRQVQQPQWRCKPKLPVAGRHILLVDDVLDSGATLQYCVNYLLDAGALSVRCAVLVDKAVAGRKFVADYVGFSAPDRYLVGCGMDSCELYRNWNYIMAKK